MYRKAHYSNKVFKGLAKHSKSSMGYFYGFKLHVIINNKGLLIDILLPHRYVHHHYHLFLPNYCL